MRKDPAWLARNGAGRDPGGEDIIGDGERGSPTKEV